MVNLLRNGVVSLVRNRWSVCSGLHWSIRPVSPVTKPIPIDYKSLFSSATPFDTITSVQAFKKGDTAVFQSRSGSHYVLFDNGTEEGDSLAVTERSMARRLAADVADPGDPCSGEQFDGSDRKKAKLSLPSGTAKTYASVSALLAALKPDAALCNAIASGPTSGRITDENQNVVITEAWLYTFKREGDEDYHLILGSTANYKTATFFTAEVSGLPKKSAPTYARLKAARDEFETELGINTCSSGDYPTRFKADPLRVMVSGALFFDAGHCQHKSKIGPSWARVRRYWEVHPVTKFKIL